MPMSISRPSALGASRVCSVESTRWPVSAASTAMCGGLAVADLADHDHVGVGAQHRAQADVERDAGLGAICICLIPAIRCSTGSSIVRMLRSPSLSDVQRGVQRRRLARAGRAGDEHRAVGLVDRRREALALGVLHAQRLEPATTTPLSRMRMHDALAVDQRQRDDADVDAPPVDRQREAAVLRHARSEMSRSAMILMRETTPAAILRLTVAAGASTPSTRNSTLRVALFGVDVDVRGALLDRLARRSSARA